MSQSNHDACDIHALFEALLEGTLTPSQAQELDALLVGDPQVRRRYVEHVHLHASLAYSVHDNAGRQRDATETLAPPAPAIAPVASPQGEAPSDVAAPPGVVTPPGFPGGGLFHSLPLMLFTLAVFGVGTALGVYFRDNLQADSASPLMAANSQRPDEAEKKTKTNRAEKVIVERAAAAADEIVLSQSAPFATLVKVAGCKWGACTLPTQTGSRLSSGLLRLDSGKAQITFDNGARLYLQGPSVFYLYGPSRTHLRSGKLVANVPEQAIGFTIETQRAEIVDLGTEFGVNVAQSGDTEVQVLDGEVEVVPPPSQSTRNTGCSRGRQDQPMSQGSSVSVFRSARRGGSARRAAIGSTSISHPISTGYCALCRTARPSLPGDACSATTLTTTFSTRTNGASGPMAFRWAHRRSARSTAVSCSSTAGGWSRSIS